MATATDDNNPTSPSALRHWLSLCNGDSINMTDSKLKTDDGKPISPMTQNSTSTNAQGYPVGANPPRPSMLASPVPKPVLPKHLADEPTVCCHFPYQMSLNLDEYMGLVHFDAGLQEVPESLATKYPHTKDGMHWHLSRNGVKIYDRALAAQQQAAAMPKAVATDHHVGFLQSRGYKVQTVQAAQTFIDNLTPMERAGFLAEAADWTPTVDTDADPDAENLEPQPGSQPTSASAPTAPVAPLVPPVPNFDVMTKDELSLYAAENLGVDVSTKLTKPEMVAKVKEELAKVRSQPVA